MKLSDRALLVSQLQRHEGLRLAPYRDTVGKLTIGYGRNLDDTGIRREEADFMLGNDMTDAESDLRRTFSWFNALDSVRQAAMVNLRFNLGLTKLLGFQHALRAMAAGHYDLAADAFFDSRWASQVGHRAVEVCAMIRSGVWPV